MDVRNCKSCGRMFNYIAGPPICDGCKAALEDKFQIVKEYVRDNKDAKMNVVAEECDVSVQQIRRWIREERLALSENSAMFIECEKCGAPIRTGRFCGKCKNKLEGEFKGVYAQPVKQEEHEIKKKGKDRMRFLDT